MYNENKEESNNIKTYEYYINKIDLNKVDINKIEHRKLLIDIGVFLEFNIICTVHDKAIESILAEHGYNPEVYRELNLIFDEEFPSIKEELYNVRGKYDKIREENEVLKKYKDINKDYLTQEERETIQKIEDEIRFKRDIEGHNLLIDKIQRIEANIDKLGPRAEEQYYSKHKAKKSASVMSVLATLFSITYAVIATFLIIKYTPALELLTQECFGEYSGTLEKGIGVFVIIVFIAFFVSAYLGCINLMSKWSENIGILALIAGVIGVVYGPLMLFQELSRGQMELELGYSDKSMSYTQVSNEYDKLKAARRINGRR